MGTSASVSAEPKLEPSQMLGTAEFQGIGTDRRLPRDVLTLQGWLIPSCDSGQREAGGSPNF